MISRMRGSRGQNGWRPTVAAAIVAAAFLVASASLPFAHHGIDCHLRSLTHCAACTVATSAKLAHDQAALLPLPARDAGPTVALATATPDSLSPRQISDRAPPSVF
jgi:hypothetical protein